MPRILTICSRFGGRAFSGLPNRTARRPDKRSAIRHKSGCGILQADLLKFLLLRPITRAS
ncbi:hypothetical protein DNK66_16935 [Klebsiella aerogenes]|nr:hypothetical protein DNK66_16935 [Klebsiella aerogenes]